MRRHLVLVVAFAAAGPASLALADTSWIFRPSTYSHNPATGERVAQYQREKPAYARIRQAIHAAAKA